MIVIVVVIFIVIIIIGQVTSTPPSLSDGELCESSLYPILQSGCLQTYIDSLPLKIRVFLIQHELTHHPKYGESFT